MPSCDEISLKKLTAKERSMFDVANGKEWSAIVASKGVDAYACIEGHIIQIADAEQAYIQADIKGTPTWIVTASEDRPKFWAEKFPRIRNPALRMIRALYGHPDAGSYREQKADKQAKKVGFISVEN